MIYEEKESYDGDDVAMDPNAAEAAAGSQPSQAASLASDDDFGGVEVDYEPGSGKDDAELAQYWPPVHADVMYYSDGGAPETPGVGVNHVHQNAGVLPAGVDHPIFGVGNLVPGNWDPVNHQYIPWNDAWNEEKQEYEFPWAPGQYNLEALPHHHPQHPEDWEPGYPLD